MSQKTILYRTKDGTERVAWLSEVRVSKYRTIYSIRFNRDNRVQSDNRRNDNYEELVDLLKAAYGWTILEVLGPEGE